MRSLGTILLMFLLALSAPAVAAEEALRQGMSAMQSGRFREALDHFDRAKQDDPEDARAYFMSGMVLFQTEQANQALKELERAVELDPTHPHYRLVSAEILLRGGYKFRAGALLDAFGSGIPLSVLSSEQLWFLSDLAFRSEDPESALRVLDRYAESSPAEDRTFFRRAQILMSLNRPEEALEAFREAREITRDRKAEANYGIGLIHFQQGRMGEALEPLRAAVGTKPDHAEFVHLLATLLTIEGQAAEALAVLERVRDQAKEHPKILDALARAHAQLGESDKAREYRQQYQLYDQESRGEDESLQRAHTILQDAQKAYKEGDLKQARARLLETLEVDPDNYLAHSYLVGLYMTQGLWQSAGRHFEQLERIDPETYETNFLGASYHYRMGYQSQALQYALKAKELQPSDAELRNLLGNIFIALGDRVKAREEYEAAVRLAPNRPEFRLNLESIRE